MPITNRLRILLGMLVILLVAGGFILYARKNTDGSSSVTPPPSPTPVATTTPVPTSSSAPATTPSPTQDPAVVAPIAEFRQRITKKFFGTHVAPGDSPVSPEKFSGFHTGIDVEYADVTDKDVSVLAIANGTVVSSRYASGYGGVMVIRHTIGDKTLYAIYGHLRQSSMTPAGRTVTQGDQIAVLGTGNSPETDGERRHLHFGIATENTITGYVSTEAGLSPTWIDPLSLYK